MRPSSPPSPIPSDAAALLDAVEADTRAVLYKARWDKPFAAEIVPKLAALLHVTDRNILLRALAAFITIGPQAASAAPAIAQLLQSTDDHVFKSAAIALSLVSLENPAPAVQPLIDASKTPGRVEYAMFALIDLGKAATPATPVFLRAFESPLAKMRRLALRGLAAVDCDPALLAAVLQRATRDRSKEVRQYAAKIAKSLPHPKTP